MAEDISKYMLAKKFATYPTIPSISEVKKAMKLERKKLQERAREAQRRAIAEDVQDVDFSE